MRIIIKMETSRNSNVEQVSVDELGLTADEWHKMTTHERDTTLQAYCDELNDQPYWVLTNYDQIY